MATAPAVPSAHAAGGKSNKKNSERIRAGAGRLAARSGQFSAAAVHVGEIAGSAFAGSLAAGFMEKKYPDMGIKIMGKVDARIVAGLAGMIAGLWKANATNHHLLNIGTGLLTSWGTDYAREKGGDLAQSTGSTSTAATTTTAVETAAPPGGGIVVGRVGRHGDGEPSRRQERRAGRIHEKIERLTGKRKRLSDGGDAPQGHIPLAWIRPEFRDEARQFFRG